MFKIKTHNQISVKGLERFPRDKYEVASEITAPDGLLLRSHVLTADDLNAGLYAIGRAGAGVNNIPVEECSAKGVVVFNAPGANANAVRELVLCGLLLGSRGIVNGIDYVGRLTEMKDAVEMAKLLEKEKKRFKGNELKGKTLGVVGLGAIGSLVAETGLMMGMNVVGYDPALSVEAAWRLPRDVQRMENLSSLLGKADFISLHLPVLDATYHMINDESLKSVKPGACLLNFAREQIVDNGAVVRSLESNGLGQFITDFPTPELIGRGDVILMPHIGASTDEAEENCAIMAADQLMDYLENGNIVNSVNFPNTSMERTPGYRLTISNNNVPKMLGSVLAVLADKDINVIDMINKSRNDLAYNIIDVESKPDQETLAAIAELDGVLNVRLL